MTTRIQNIDASIEACAAHYGENANAVKDYLIEGQNTALALPNRGKLTFDSSGRLSQEIRDAYSKYGFYVFEGLINEDELSDIRQDLDELKRRFPVNSSAKVSASGEPAMNAECKVPTLLWAKPLGDPLGGSSLANGRHQVKLIEPKAADDAPDEAPFILLGSNQFSEACLRTYAHPDLLRGVEVC